MHINIPSFDNFDINFHYRIPIPIGDDDSGNVNDGRRHSPPSFIVTDEKHLQQKQELELKILQFKLGADQAKAESEIAKAKVEQRAAEARAPGAPWLRALGRGKQPPLTWVATVPKRVASSKNTPTLKKSK